MGMFDTIYVESKLLHDHHMLCEKCGLECIEFQTKDLDSTLEYYYLHYVNGIGKLHFMKSVNDTTMFDPSIGKAFNPIEIESEWPHKWMDIYASCIGCNQWNEYKLKFTDGVLQNIERAKIVTK